MGALDFAAIWLTSAHTSAMLKLAILEPMSGRTSQPAALPSKFALLDVLDKDRSLLTSGCCCNATGAACPL